MAQDRTLSVDSLLSGARKNVKQTRGMREHLADLFYGDDYVKVKNSLGEDFGYVYTDPREETVSQPDKVTRLVDYGDPKARVIKAGQTVVMQGWEAYLAITHMWKKYAQSQRDIKMSVVLSNTSSMRQFLSQTYLGKFDPSEINMGDTIDVPQVVETQAPKPADEDLGFADEEEEKTPPTRVEPVKDQADEKSNKDGKKNK